MKVTGTHRAKLQLIIHDGNNEKAASQSSSSSQSFSRSVCSIFHPVADSLRSQRHMVVSAHSDQRQRRIYRRAVIIIYAVDEEEELWSNHSKYFPHPLRASILWLLVLIIISPVIVQQVTESLPPHLPWLQQTLYLMNLPNADLLARLLRVRTEPY